MLGRTARPGAWTAIALAVLAAVWVVEGRVFTYGELAPSVSPERDVDLVVYFRLPKSGSTSWEALLERSCNASHVEMKRGPIRARRLDGARAAELALQLAAGGNAAPLVYSRHFYFVDLAAAAAASVPAGGGALRRWAYTSVVRHPVDRCVSRYRYSQPELPAPLRSLSIEECVERDCLDLPPFARDEDLWRSVAAASSPMGPPKKPRWSRAGAALSVGGAADTCRTPECTALLVRLECHNYMVRWFCGADDEICAGHPLGEAALGRALRVVESKFAIIGLT